MARKKKRKAPSEASIELNVMPFIDIFSLLCTFLLFSAVFVSIGIHEVQIPFLSNAAPPPPEEKKKKLNVEFKVDIDKNKLSLEVRDLDTGPRTLFQKNFEFSTDGLKDFHKILIQKKQAYQGDSLTLYTQDDLTFDQITQVLDSIKLIEPGDQVSSRAMSEGLFTKVIMGSVLL